MNYKYYVYAWFIEETGEIFYIGKGCGPRVKNKKQRNKRFRDMLASTDKELTLVRARNNKRSLKAKCDAIDVDNGIIYDIKSISNLNYHKRHINSYLYQIQACYYSLVAEKIYGKPFKFIWVFVEKKEGHRIKFVDYDDYKSPHDLNNTPKALKAYDDWYSNDKFDKPKLPKVRKKKTILLNMGGK